MPRAGLDPQSVTVAAAELVDREGFERLTLARLADELRVRSPSLYVHIDGLGDLRGRLGALGADALRAGLLAALAAAGDRPGRDSLEAVATAYREFAAEHPGLYAAVLAAPPATHPEWEAAGAAAVEVLYEVVGGYGLQGEAAVHGVRLVRAALHGLVSLQAAGGFALSDPLEATWARMIDTLDLGLSELSW